MSPLDQIRESIEARIAELKSEIAVLQTARAALHGKSAISTAAATSTNSGAEARRRRTPKAASNAHSTVAATKTSNGAGANAPSATVTKVATKSAGRPSKPRARPQAQRAKSEKRVEVLLAGKLEAMLREAEDGLSAITICKRSNAGYRQVLDLLRDLESAGQVRRTGTRRTSLWRLITDEERIAVRAAELESLSIAKSGRSPDRR
jgi:hypothetical protein